MKLPSWIKSTSSFLKKRRIEREIDGLGEYNLFGYKRIYLIHIRKTGGTSLNHMFLSLGDRKNTNAFYQKLAAEPDHRLIKNGKVFVGWNKKYINEGKYFYAFSHIPEHQLALPKGTFTLTCLRDPVKRIISHYRMLSEYRENKIKHPCMKIEGPWLGDTFDDFLDRIPKEHLLNQLYMFSSDFNVNQALDRIMNVSHCLFLEDLAKGIHGLNKKLGMQLEAINLRKSNWNCKISKKQSDRLREKLEQEYVLLNLVREEHDR